MPPFKPFTSFLTQGMQNTNQFTNPYQSPVGGSPFYGRKPVEETSQAGTGPYQGIQDAIIGTGSYDIPTGPDDPEYNPQGAPIGQGPMPRGEELPPGWTWQWVNGEWTPQGPGGSVIDPGSGGEDFFTGAGGTVIDPGYDYSGGDYFQEGTYGGALGQGTMWDKYGTMEGGFDVNNDGVIDALDALMYSSDEFWQGQEGYYTDPTEGVWVDPTEGYYEDTTYGNITGFEEFGDWGLDLAGQYGYNPNIQVDNPETTSFEEFMQNYVNNFNWESGGGQGPTPPQANMSQEEMQQWLSSMSESQLAAFQNQWNNEYGQAYDETPWILDENPTSWEDYLGQSEDFQSEQDYAGQSLEDLFQQQAPWETQGDWIEAQEGYYSEDPTEGYYTDPVASQATQAGYGIGGPQEGFLGNLSSMITGGVGQAPSQFAGGGGAGGGTARQLHYPSTEGGFASVGKGLSQPKSLQELLAGLGGQ